MAKRPVHIHIHVHAPDDLDDDSESGAASTSDVQALVEIFRSLTEGAPLLIAETGERADFVRVDRHDQVVLSVAGQERAYPPSKVTVVTSSVP